MIVFIFFVLEHVSVWALAQIFQRIIAAIDFGKMGAHQVEADDTPIELHQEDLIDQIGRTGVNRLSLRAAFTGRTRVEAIGLFLATLELVRQRRVRVLQDKVHDDILFEGRVVEVLDEEDEHKGTSAQPMIEIELKPDT